MTDYIQMFTLMVACSFIATLILCSRDSFRWRQFRFRSSDSSGDGVTSEDTEQHEGLSWWRGFLLALFILPLAVVIIPVMTGALPAMLLYVGAARYRWLRRAVRRALRRRGVVCSWLFSSLIAILVLFTRCRRLGKVRHAAS